MGWDNLGIYNRMFCRWTHSFLSFCSHPAYNITESCTYTVHGGPLFLQHPAHNSTHIPCHYHELPLNSGSINESTVFSRGESA